MAEEAKKTDEKMETKEKKLEEKKEEHKTEEIKTEAKEEKKEEKKPEKAKIVKKESATVNTKDAPISTIQAKFICKFIKGKTIDNSLEYLQKVTECKKAIPCKGEYSHRHGGEMMAGSYPVTASKVFIKLLKSLAANASLGSINNPIITEAIANQASRPRRRFGKYKFKRTHVFLKAVEYKEKK